MGGHGSGRKNRTTEVMNSMKGQQFEPKAPIATEMFLPNLSGIASHPEFKNSTTFVKVAGDTMTGALQINSTLGVTGISTLGRVTATGISTFNDAGFTLKDALNDTILNLYSDQDLNDSVSAIDYVFNNSQSIRTVYGRDTITLKDRTNTSEDADMDFDLIKAGTIRTYISYGVTNDIKFTPNTAVDIVGNLTVSGTGHDGFSDFVANEHINHTSITLTAGAGMTGGGDISANRTFNVIGGTGITVNANDIQTNDSAIVHDNLSGFVANEHIDWTSTSSNFSTSGTAATGNLTVTGTGKFTKEMDFAEKIVFTGNDTTTLGQTEIFKHSNVGLTLLGSGAVSDIWFGNKDGANIFKVATGTINVEFLGDISVAKILTVKPVSNISTIQTNNSDTRMDFITDRATATNVSFKFRDAANNALMEIRDNGTIKIPDLAGTGTRNVVVDANGIMSAP